MAASYKLLAASIVNLVLLLMKSLCPNKISRKGAKRRKENILLLMEMKCRTGN
jgi:hypothetical protein